MRNYIIPSVLFVLLICYSPEGKGQGAGSRAQGLGNITLDEAIQLGVSNSPKLISQKLKLQKEEQELSRVKLSKIPDINVTGDLRRNIIIPTTPIPASIMNPAADPDQMLYMKFNTGWNSTAGINLSLDIFNPATYRQTKDQKIKNKITEYDLQISENDLRADIAKAYAACVISQDQVESFSSDTAFYRKSLDESETLYSRQNISLTEKNNAFIAYNTSIMQYQNAVNVLNESKANLLYLLGMETSAQKIDLLHVAEDIDALYNKMNPVAQGYVRTKGDFVATGTELSRQSEIVVLTQNQVRSSRMKIAPSLSLKGFYGSNFYSNDFDFGNGDFWHGNSYLALSLKVPLTQSLATNKETSQLKLQKQIETENLREMQNLKSREWLDAKNKLIVSMREYEILQQNYELSLENLNASKAQLDKEYIQEKDFLQEKVTNRNAYQSFLQAAYNVFLNTIELKKIVGE
ncbi:MAG TPA: TolC family protein [Bacteroidales bacterium]|nr:TolC family protein [Bacteroidales bacterium]